LVDPQGTHIAGQNFAGIHLAVSRQVGSARSAFLMLRGDDARAVVEVSAGNVGNAVRPKAGVVVQGWQRSAPESRNGCFGELLAASGYQFNL
jgi:hypothetical protein